MVIDRRGEAELDGVEEELERVHLANWDLQSLTVAPPQDRFGEPFLELLDDG